MNDINRFVLGTAQLGMSYGINNATGQPSFSLAKSIINAARSHGIKTLDTADAYGQSADILGEIGVSDFRVLSKFILSGSQSSLSQALKVSLHRLRLSKLGGYSFHRFDNFQSFDFRSEVAELKKNQNLEKLGISIYSNSEFEAAISSPDIDLIQIPFNVLDNWSVKGALIQQAVVAGKEVHARSIFLQGLFFMSLVDLPPKLEVLKTNLMELRQIAKDVSLSVAELCLGYVLAKESIAGLVIGLESTEQLEQNVQIFRSVKLDPETVARIEDIQVVSREMLNPSSWK